MVTFFCFSLTVYSIKMKPFFSFTVFKNLKTLKLFSALKHKVIFMKKFNKITYFVLVSVFFQVIYTFLWWIFTFCAEFGEKFCWTSDFYLDVIWTQIRTNSSMKHSIDDGSEPFQICSFHQNQGPVYTESCKYPEVINTLEQTTSSR